jgi:glycerol-3-phosphate dehydrogenase
VAVTHEGARSLDDVLRRRLRVAIESRDAGGLVADRVADLMKDQLGWSSQERDDQIEQFFSVVNERGQSAALLTQ